jgi:predicted nuclease of predicted toxin-antitoxin system
MKFLVDADLPRRTPGLFRRYGHEAVHVCDVGIGSASDVEVAAHAQSQGMCLVTGDFGFADVRNYPPEKYPGMVVLQLPRTATADSILSLMESLLRQEGILEHLSGRLAIVSWGGIRLRPRPKG